MARYTKKCPYRVINTRSKCIEQCEISQLGCVGYPHKSINNCPVYKVMKSKNEEFDKLRQEIYIDGFVKGQLTASKYKIL